MISQELWPPPLISETDDTQQNAPLLFFSLSRFSSPASTRPDLIPLLGCHAFRWPCGGKGQYGNIITRRWSIGDNGRKKRARVSGTDRCRTERKAKDLLYMVGEERRGTGEEEELLLQLSVACMCVWKNGEDALLCLSASVSTLPIHASPSDTIILSWNTHLAGLRVSSSGEEGVPVRRLVAQD
jgi:hypothetical protein